MKRPAQLLVGLSILLLIFVSIDFFQVKKLNKEPNLSQQKSNLVDKVNEIGQVLPTQTGGSTYYYKFYLKDQTGTAITTQSVDAALIKGAAITVTNKSSFTCGDTGSNYTFAEVDGFYKLICNEAATMNIKISKSGYSTKNTSVAYYQGEIPTIYLSRYVAPPPPPPPETIKDVKLPSEFSETGGSTNLAAIADPTKVEDLTLDTGSSTIKYREAVDLSSTETKNKFKELNKYVKTDQVGVVGVDSTSVPVLNKKATITMKTLSFVKTPKVLVDGREDKAVVSNITYKDGTLTFDVEHFSTFTAAPTIGIEEPANNFETKDKTIKLKGTVSDPTATVSAKLNNKDLGKVKVATSGAYEKELELEEGENKIVVSALSKNLATASASVSGTLKKAASLAWIYALLGLLSIIGISGAIYGYRKMKTDKTEVKTAASSQVTEKNSEQVPNELPK